MSSPPEGRDVNGRAPPALAVWLLARLGHGYRAESLAGDLLEQFHSGRSAAWYWRQVFRTVLLARARRWRAPVSAALALLRSTDEKRSARGRRLAKALAAALAAAALGFGALTWASNAAGHCAQEGSSCHRPALQHSPDWRRTR